MAHSWSYAKQTCDFENAIFLQHLPKGIYVSLSLKLKKLLGVVAVAIGGDEYCPIAARADIMVWYVSIIVGIENRYDELEAGYEYLQHKVLSLFL